jgi:hypothetical protein
VAKKASGARRDEQREPLDRRSAALLVLVAATAAYLPALGNGFVWDDPLILENQLPAFRTWADVLVPPRNLPHSGSFYYRPLVFSSYLFDRWAGGGSPIAFHATPIILHALASGLLLLLLWHLLGRRTWLAPTLGAAMFAIHPVHVEAVAWMAGRGDLLATIAVIGALLAWGRWWEEGRTLWLVVGSAALLLGLVSKEVAAAGVVLAAALPWVWPAPPSARRRAAWPLWSAIGAAVLLFALLRGTAFSLTPGATRAPSPSSVTVELVSALGFYVAALLFPLQPGVVLSAVPTGGGAFALGIVGTIVFLGGLTVALWRRAFLPAWGLLWIAVALAPALLLVVRYISETPLAERYLYLPSAGAAVVIGWAASKLPARWRPSATIAAAVILLAIGFVTASRSLVWRDEISFWSNAVALAPDEGRRI